MIDYPFIKGDEIPALEELGSSADLEQLFLHIISHFYEEIDAYGSNKTQLLSSIKSILTEYIPAVYPQYYADYPDSLPDIYALIEETIKINQERRTSLPDLFSLMETTETA